MPSRKVAIIKKAHGDLPGGFDSSMQSRADQDLIAGGDGFLVPLLVQWGSVADELSPWWSPRRDRELRQVWRKDPFLSNSIYTMQAILSTIGWVVEGPKPDVQFSRTAFENAEFGQGMKVLIKKLAEDWFTQDNGIFMEMIGPGAIDTPLLTPPEGIAHIDAGRCWRTNDPEFPIYYMGQTKGWIKVHWTRVAFSAPNPSPIELARGIGFCVTSRIALLSRMMRDTVRYKMEKISGRQTRAIMTVSGAPRKAVELAMSEAERAADELDQIRYSAIPVIASPSGGQQITADLLELAKVPDGFKWEDEVQLYMYILALALGIDARELWPATQSGATKADAEVQHRKAMRKGVGDFVSTFEDIANKRIVVGDAAFGFKPKDNEEDQNEANVHKTRAETAQTMITAQVVTPRGGTLWLVNNGVLPAAYMDNPDLAPQTAAGATDAPDVVVGGGPSENTVPEGGDQAGPEITPTTQDESGQPAAMAKKEVRAEGVGLIRSLYNKIRAA